MWKIELSQRDACLYKGNGEVSQTDDHVLLSFGDDKRSYCFQFENDGVRLQSKSDMEVELFLHPDEAKGIVTTEFGQMHVPVRLLKCFVQGQEAFLAYELDKQQFEFYIQWKEQA
jgi:hypothetical protein